MKTGTPPRPKRPNYLHERGSQLLHVVMSTKGGDNSNSKVLPPLVCKIQEKCIIYCINCMARIVAASGLKCKKQVLLEKCWAAPSLRSSTIRPDLLSAHSIDLPYFYLSVAEFNVWAFPPSDDLLFTLINCRLHFFFVPKILSAMHIVLLSAALLHNNWRSSASSNDLLWFYTSVAEFIAQGLPSFLWSTVHLLTHFFLLQQLVSMKIISNWCTCI